MHYVKNGLGRSASINGVREDYDEFAQELGEVVSLISDSTSLRLRPAMCRRAAGPVAPTGRAEGRPPGGIPVQAPFGRLGEPDGPQTPRSWRANSSQAPVMAVDRARSAYWSEPV